MANWDGITLFQMDAGVDFGPIVGQKEEQPSERHHCRFTWIEERGLELLQEVLPQLVHGTLKLKQQDENKRRIMPQRSPEDGLIDWN